MRKLLMGASILFMSACGEQATDALELRTSQSEIVNGYVDNGHYQVVSINSNGSLCTGTMIGKRTVLTAAHCVQNGGRSGVSGTARYYDYELRVWETEPFYAAGTAYRHPNYTGTYPYGPDVAVIVLDSNVWGAVVASLSSSTPVSSQVTLVGFGYTSSGGADYGTLRYGYNNIDGADATYFYHSGASGSDATICFGDSGGPAFLGGYSSNCVAGVAHATYEPACTSKGGIHTRVDNVAAWIRSIATETISGC